MSLRACAGADLNPRFKNGGGKSFRCVWRLQAESSCDPPALIHTRSGRSTVPKSWARSPWTMSRSQIYIPNAAELGISAQLSAQG